MSRRGGGSGAAQKVHIAGTPRLACFAAVASGLGWGLFLVLSGNALAAALVPAVHPPAVARTTSTARVCLKLSSSAMAFAVLASSCRLNGLLMPPQCTTQLYHLPP